MNRWRTCKHCRKEWKRAIGAKEMRAVRRSMREHGKKMKTFYPHWVWHTEPTRLCAQHNLEAIVDSSRRRAAEIKATPSWANKAAIRDVYARAREIQRCTGDRMEVDHVIPLRGRNVCGLHIETNLQVLKAEDNRRKSNNFAGDVGELPAGASSLNALPE